MIDDPYLADMMKSMLAWCEKAETIASYQQLDSFRVDEIRQLALAKVVEQIGETAGRMLERWPDWVKANQQLRLIDAYAMRNRLVHGYDRIDLEILFYTARETVPQLAAQLRTILGGFDDKS
ncbi:hypothetical protein IMCC20628_01882 [Hoeflea sp. IMCC20628]|uniref:HepT-like ribonuclease domain-containing protein n=1 Tax=Hoeflea sp. IMCC20628 TaxID=1620421 RepID=UPI00063BE38E|nr:DUF86 domain-containing protein [Hoeflea sp. IMCC20628]AKI00588.1 hypothetical protein IMCC20628_01882 [Hoeflea sp. IMCC20628]